MTCFNIAIFPYCIAAVGTFFSEAIGVQGYAPEFPLPSRRPSFFDVSHFYPPLQSFRLVGPAVCMSSIPRYRSFWFPQTHSTVCGRVVSDYSVFAQLMLCRAGETSCWDRAQRMCPTSQPGLQGRTPKRDLVYLCFFQQSWSSHPETQGSPGPLKIPGPLL